MIISIANADLKFGIGKNNDLLFHLPKDMAFFREITKGHVVCMGRNTLVSFPGSKPLKNRVNIVLDNDLSESFDGCIMVRTMEDFLKIIKEYGEKEDVFIIGGASIYNQTIDYVDKVYLTRVYKDGEATVFFPNLDEKENFEIESSSEDIDDNGITIRFVTYVNKNKKVI